MHAFIAYKRKMTMMLAVMMCFYFAPDLVECDTSEVSTDKKRIMIISGHPGYPPIMWQDGKTIKGTGVELAVAMCRELKIPCEVRYSGPWKRVQERARDGVIDLIVGIYANNERKKYLDYTVPYMSEHSYIAVMRGREFVFRKKEDLIGKAGVTIHGESFGQALDDFIQSSLNIKRVYTAEALFKNLITGRADYLLWGYYPILTSSSKMGVADRVVTYDKTPIAVENLYMAISKKSAFTGRLKEMDLIIQRFRKKGDPEKLSQKYVRDYLRESTTAGILTPKK